MDEALLLTRAFPQALHDDVAAVLRVLPSEPRPTPHAIGPITIEGEPIHIPVRIYAREVDQAALASCTETQRRILHCRYTRHHDGYVRQRHLGPLLACDEAWVVPFVVQLVGEYVLPILVDIEAALGPNHTHAYGAFVRENEAFMRLTGARVCSYWNAYERSRFIDRRTYPGERILRRLASFARTPSM
jgi:hypothetical protein